MIIPVKTSQGSYDIVLERGSLKRAGELLNLKRRVLVVTDSGVPKEYAEAVASGAKKATILTIKEGEQSKNIEVYAEILKALVENGFTRTDCVVAVGGGVVGDLSGFAAASFMRGIDFYNIPTTVLSQVDSSIGGKTAIDFMGLKNIVGAFYPPKKVIIDPDTLKTLPARQISNGLCEAVKMAATSDRELFELFEKENALTNIDKIIEMALRIKKAVVEEDEREAGLRKVLNFGHTLAHALESVNSLSNYYHGECVAVGMLAMCSESARERIKAVLKKLSLPTELSADADEIIEASRHDKKAAGDDITIVFVNEIGSFELRKIPFGEYE
ncbi:MAG: 3-dehydroquinate synthase, partial [Oscillospiraceae bacterium]|nr:3-dehydroquinate synthase [Oscillospiraceae bacterium]